MRRLQLDDLLVLAALAPHSPEAVQECLREGSSSWSALCLVQRNSIDWQRAESKEEN